MGIDTGLSLFLIPASPSRMLAGDCDDGAGCLDRQGHGTGSIHPGGNPGENIWFP